MMNRQETERCIAAWNEMASLLYRLRDCRKLRHLMQGDLREDFLKEMDYTKASFQRALWAFDEFCYTAGLELNDANRRAESGGEGGVIVRITHPDGTVERPGKHDSGVSPAEGET